MSEILEAAKYHFREKLAGELGFYEVAEWVVKGKPIKIYFKPAMNMAQQERIQAMASNDKQGEAVCETLIQRALNEDGTRMFRSTDKLELMRHVDPSVLSKIILAMVEDSDVEEAAKN